MPLHHAVATSNASPTRRELPAAEIVERRLIGVDVADARAAFDRHVADRHPLVHRQPRDGVAGVLVGEPDAAVDAEPTDDLENDVLGVDPRREPARHENAADLQRIERQALRRQHVAHLRGADAERDRAERAVGRRVAVAARDRHPRLGQAELRPDHMDDALRAALKIEQPHAVLAAVALERGEHVLRHHVDERPAHIARRHDVIDGRDRAFRILHPPAPRPKHVERLRAGHLVDEMKTDEQLRLAVGQLADGVGVPDFLEEG